MDLDVEAIAGKFQELNDFAYSTYKPLVDRILMENASESEVEHLLDYMLGVCQDDRMLGLFKQVCRRYYKQFPEMITAEIFYYKEMYEDSNDR